MPEFIDYFDIVRIIKQPYWELKPLTAHTVIGGRPEYTLKYSKTLEYFDKKKQKWLPVEVVEKECPPYPKRVM